MTNQHLIIPPPELRCQWQSESPFKVISVEREDYMIDRAAQWGADQELEACRDWLFLNGYGEAATISKLIAARRPKPPSLKVQALASLAELESPGRCDEPGYESLYNTIRRALEALDD